MVDKGSDPLDLIARMCHDIRTPLGAILGFAQLMESGTPPPTASQQERLALILQAGWYLENLIDMTNDLALIESGAVSLCLENVPLAAVMLDVQAMIESKARMRGVRVSFPLVETACFVSADRNRLQQVLGNLLSAAIECSELGGSLVVGCEPQNPEWLRIGIEDGGGLSQRFNSPEQQATPAEGTGIGLILAKRLVDLMGGTLGPQTTVGTGTVFSFDLKRSAAPMAAGRKSIAFNAAKTASNTSETLASNTITGLIT
jgi:signal transduction histidine kinase